MSTATIEKSDVPLAALIQLCHYRWGVGVVAALWESRGSKFVTMANQLGVSRDALGRTLAGLDDMGLVMRNPGYGHPMRPEYLLTPDGETAGPAAMELAQLIARRSLTDVSGRKWTLPAVAALAEERTRFGQLESALPGVTPRALTQALKLIEDAGLAKRIVVAEHPPRTEYRLSRLGVTLSDPTLRLAKALSLDPDD